MAASFAAYASQFLNKQQNPAASSLASSQPLFFSFSTDDGSHTGHIPDGELDDAADPHLRASAASTTRGRERERERDRRRPSEDDEDPYLRLDEDDPVPSSSRYPVHAAPLLGASADTEHSKGWLAHQASPMRSPSPASSTDSAVPPASLFGAPASPPRRPQQRPRSPQMPPPPPRAALALSLTESLLPRDGHARPLDVFSLPDPRHVPRGRRKYHDTVWIALWCTGVAVCLVACVLVLFLTRTPARTTPPRRPLPYTTLLHTVPLLTILIFVAAAAAYAHIFLLRIFVKPVMVATSVFVPATLLISALWAFVGSFMWEAGLEPTWGETIGLRLFALVPLVLALFTARRLLDLPRDIHTTSSLLDLATRVLLANPFLLALSPTILLAALLLSVPFLTLVFRLLLIGYVSPAGTGWEYHVKAWADWAIVGVVVVWLWSWGVARGVLRVAAAGVIGAWYFADPALPPPPPTSTHTLHAALTRATEPSFGSIILSALILTAIRALALSSAWVRRLAAAAPLPLRPWVAPVALGVGMLLGWIENAARTRTLSPHALVYVGLTGDAFFPSAKRAKQITAAAEGGNEGRYKRKFKTEPPLTLLTVAPLTLTFPLSLITYLFVAHTLGAPNSALGAALLAGAVTALVGLFCVGLVKDTAETLYICYCIDKDQGRRHRDEVFKAFEYETRRPAQAPPPPPPAPVPQARRGSLPPVHGPLPAYPEYSPSPSPSPSPPPTLHPGAARAAAPAQAQHLPVDLEAQSGLESGLGLGMGMGMSSALAMEDSQGTAATGEYDDTGDEAEGEESQLFPGSDLF